MINNLILDMDGVLWQGETPLPGLNAFFERLEQRQIPYVLATNNATKDAQQYVDKLARFGVAVPPEKILTSSEATAGYIRQTYPEAKSVYIVGEESLGRTVAKQGFELSSAEAVRQGQRPDIVVAGLVRESLSYELVAMATLAIRAGAVFVGTNDDATYPTELGPLPGAGSILALLEAATKVKPVVIGKPAPYLFEEALRRLVARPEDTAMVGDRLNTDIAGGKAAGLKTILLLTGVSTQAELAGSSLQADYVFEDLPALTAALELR